MTAMSLSLSLPGSLDDTKLQLMPVRQDGIAAFLPVSREINHERADSLNGNVPVRATSTRPQRQP